MTSVNWPIQDEYPTDEARGQTIPEYIRKRQAELLDKQKTEEESKPKHEK